MKKIVLSALAVGAALSSTQAAPLVPLGATGWNQDIVIGVGETLAGRTETMDGGNINTTWYGLGFNSGAPSTGLPIGLTTSQATADLSFTLQPFTAVNAVYAGGTLTLDTPVVLLRLALIGSTGNAGQGADVTITVTHADATTSVFGPGLGNVGVNRDWVNSFNPPTYDANGRVDVGGGPGTPGTFNFVNSEPSPKLFENIFNISNPSNVVSVTISDPAGNGRSAIMAISGEAVPEPSALGLAGLTTLGIAAFRRRRA